MSKLLWSAVEISRLIAATGITGTVGDNNTNANAIINILSITAGCKQYICSSQFIGDSVTTLQDPVVGWEGMKFG